MKIGELAKATTISVETIRYYEKIGLLKNVQRNASGHRVYTQKDFDWVRFIKRLKETGMPLENILQYAALREKGVTTTSQRQQLLEQHQQRLKIHIQQQQQHLLALEEKIHLYKDGKVR